MSPRYEDESSRPRGVSGSRLGAVNPAIPFRLRIGVTGHRVLPDSPGLADQIARTVERIRSLVPAGGVTPIQLAVLSPLAEGADRLVADVVLAQPDAVLEAVLPLAQQDYQNDFTAPGSLQQFSELLDRAVRIVELPATETREEAYEQAGQFVVEQSDVLIAVWDGHAAQGQGGTAEVVVWARDRGTPVFWIHPMPPFTLTEWLGTGMDLTAFQHIDRFNRAELGEVRLAAALDVTRADIDAHARAADIDPAVLEPIEAWLLPTSVRADLLASQAQRQFFRFSDATFVIAVLAVLASASPQLLGNGFPPAPFRFHAAVRFAPLIECVLMFVVLMVIYVGHRNQLHQRWIAYRFLAERLRSAFFMALIDAIRVGADRAPEFVTLHQPSDAWIQTAFDVVWQRRPAGDPSIPLEHLRRFLARAWIGDQRAYQDRKSQRHARANHLLGRMSIAVFTVTLCISALDSFDGWRQGFLGGVGPTIALYLSIVFPALAGALGGIGALRDHPRNARRSTTMARQLARLERHVERAPDLPTLRSFAHQAEALMLEESGDWYVSMQFRDVSLHT
ncbi:MAG TPA: hypothetical protein VNL35_06945 [Chloroflexota bacterium]|nr:hypothetical protein [Chloroflexota bacterium]